MPPVTDRLRPKARTDLDKHAKVAAQRRPNLSVDHTTEAAIASLLSRCRHEVLEHEKNAAEANQELVRRLWVAALARPLSCWV